MKLGLFVLLLVLMACCHTVSHAFAPSTVQLPILAKKINLNMIKQASRASREIANPLWIGPNFAKFVTGAIMGSAPMVKLAASTPPLLKGFLKNVYPWDLVMLILFQLTHKKFLKFAHKTQRIAWKWASFGEPQPWDKSILGFVCERCSSLSKVLAATYMVKVGCMVLARLGLGISADFPGLISRIVVTIFVAQFVDKFKSKFLRTFFPKVGESRRQSYIVNKTTSVAIWTVGVLVVCEMLSVFLKVPLSSTLAFGGVGGLALGLSLRDMAANFVGGMILLLNEPFTPGDMITFRSGRTLLVGRVERVGWAQTRMRGKDTRPTYVPNSHFVKAALTNMERITHRKYETTVPLRFQDQLLVPQVIENIKTRLQDINKLDTLSMPCRVSFVKMSTYSLDIEITCYFATKSVDEFLDLQQQANLEVLAAINECGAGLALPTSSLQVGAAATTAAAAAAATGALQTPSQAAEAAAAILVDGGAGIEAALDNPALEEIHQQQLLKQEREEAEDPLEVSESSVSRAKDDKDVQELADAVHDTPIRLSPSAAQHPMRRGSSSSSIVKTAKRTVIDGVEVEAADTRGVGGEGGQGSVEAAEEEEEDMESEMTPLQVVGGGDALKDMAQELELVDALRVVTPSQQQQQQQQQQQEEEMMMMLESDEELPLQGELQDLGGVGVFQAALLDAEQDLGLPVVDAEREMEMEEEESTLSTASIPDSTTTTPTAGATVAVAVAEEEAPRKQRKGTVIPPVYPEHKQVNTYAARSAVPTEAAAAAGIEESETRTSTTPSAPVHDVVANSGSSTGAENLNGIPDPMAVAAATATSLDASIGTSSGANIWQASMEAAGIRTNARQHIIDHAEIHGTTTASSSSSSSTTTSSSSSSSQQRRRKEQRISAEEESHEASAFWDEDDESGDGLTGVEASSDMNDDDIVDDDDEDDDDDDDDVIPGIVEVSPDATRIDTSTNSNKEAVVAFASTNSNSKEMHDNLLQQDHEQAQATGGGSAGVAAAVLDDDGGGGGGGGGQLQRGEEMEPGLAEDQLPPPTAPHMSTDSSSQSTSPSYRSSDSESTTIESTTPYTTTGGSDIPMTPSTAIIVDFTTGEFDYKQ